MKEIFEALVKAQKEFGPALKTSTNPHFRTKYAALDACIEAVIDALNNNGIMLMQQTHLCEDGVIVETTFLHESGQQFSAGKLHIPASKHDPQGFGGALTYARRYSLQAACGIAPEDDDANKATASYIESKKVEPKLAIKQALKPVDKVTSGKGGEWNIVLKEREDGDWAGAIMDAVNVALELAKSADDVNNIFKVNKAHFDRLKEETPTVYADALEILKKTKQSFTQE
jgi:hypothetical protein